MKKYRCYITNKRFRVGTIITEHRYNSLSSQLQNDFKVAV